MFLFQLNGLAKREDIQYICELIFETTFIPICFLNRDGNILFEYNNGGLCNPLYPNKDTFYRQFFDHEQIDTIPCFYTTKYMENFFTIAMIQQDTLLGTIIVGPSLYSEMDNDTINTLVSELDVPIRLKASLKDYYQTLHVNDYKKMMSISILLHYNIYNKKLDSIVIFEKNSQNKNTYNKIDSEINNELLKNRQFTVYHHAPLYEKYLLQYVKEGNKERLLNHLSKYPGGESGVLSKNPLRSQKNLFICSVTLISRAAIEGGLGSELALTISDSYIQRAEQLNEINELVSLHYKMLSDFTDRVYNVKDKNYSAIIVKCCNYIFQHLYEDITSYQLSEVSGVSANYLSELFKKEVGIPITEYVQKERIEEAKKLLSLTDQSILDICVVLNFNDQSYFTKVFKKFSGVTPKQYKDMHNKLVLTL